MLENIWLDTHNSKEFLMLYDNLKLLSTRYNLWKKEEEGYRFCYANHMVPVWIIDDKIIFSYVDDKDDGYGNTVKTSIDRYTIPKKHIDYMVYYDISYSFYKKGERFPKDDFNFWIKTKKNEKSGVERLCCCTNDDIDWAISWIGNRTPIDKRIEISLKDGSIDMWTYKE